MNETEMAGTVAPETRGRLIRLLTAELVAAWEAALALGATRAELAAVVDERRRAILELPQADISDDYPDQ